MFAAADEIVVTLVVAWIYLTVVRFVDVNEREPVWALAVAFVMGVVVAMLGEALVSSPDLALFPWRQAIVAEVSKAAALLATAAVFAGVARVRGWSELTDLVDGMVYGIAVGLGYAAGTAILKEFATADLGTAHLLQPAGRAVVATALAGLSQGVFAAVTGLGLGAAIEVRGRVAQVILVGLGLVGAVVLNALFFVLAHGNALGGATGQLRAWLAVIIPLVMLVAVGLFSLAAERRAIRVQLAAEVRDGVVTAADAALVDSFWARQVRYIGLLLRGRLRECLALAARHNRQVQLAVLARRAERAGSRPDGEAARRQADVLRAALVRARTPVTMMFLAVGLHAVARPGREAAAQTQWPSSESLIEAARKDIDDFWRRELVSLYRSPQAFGPYVTGGACAPKRNNAEYCARVRSIYYDPRFLDAQHREIGDFATVFIVAHEFAHYIQDLMGNLRPEAGLFGIQIELQADCYAGRYARNALARKLLEPGDEDEAIRSLRKARDPVDFPWFAPGAHGSGGQRIDAFTEGFDGRQCEGAEFWRRVHVDPGSAQAPPTPARGSLLRETPCVRGRFDRRTLAAAPDLVRGTVTDGVRALFRSADGVEISVERGSFVTAAAAAAFLEAAHPEGYTLRKQGNVVDGARQLGRWKLFAGRTEVVVMNNLQVVDVIEGPLDAVWEFVTSTAEMQCRSR
jgi:predicted metalloprotease